MPTHEEWIERYKKHVSEDPRSGHGPEGGHLKDNGIHCPGYPCNRCLVCVVGSTIISKISKISKWEFTVCNDCSSVIPKSRISLELLIADSLTHKKEKP